MLSKLVSKLLFAGALAFVLALTPMRAQVVASGMTGVVTDGQGKPSSGVTVTATHVSTGTVYTATTGSTGRYNFRGLVVGGPYTVAVAGDSIKPAQQTDVTTQLGATVDVSFDVDSAAEVVTLEKLTVSSSTNELDATATGAGTVLSAQRISLKPTTERSLADMISASPFVTLRSTFGDREESQITALGQNNRFNSVQIDGSRINDQFGLNGTGLASFFNPLSTEWIEQLSVQISPYDIRSAGFTGASVNAVTKSGTNQFHGATYYLFRGDQLSGLQLQGYNPREEATTGAKVLPRLERSTWGVFVGGPIIKNKLFFFAGYENFESTISGRDIRFSTPAESQILTRLGQMSSKVDWGTPVTGQTANISKDEKYVAKMDWNINSDHRMSLRYLTAEGKVPQFGNYGNATSNLNSLSGGPIASSSGHFYAQSRKEKSIAAQVFSQWTPDLKTELRYATTKQDQLTPLNSVAPMVYIFGVSGTDLLSNRAITNGTYVVGTDEFRQGNQIAVKSDQFAATADYFLNNFVFTFGAEREQSDFYNLFRAGSYGRVAFPTFNDFLNDTNANIQRAYYDPARRPVGDMSEFATTGLFGQAKWDVFPRLALTFGVRYEFAESGLTPALNQALLTTTGFRNDGTIDGAESISPRISFNLAIDSDRKTQLKGGFGHFLGRAPWVIFSNSFGATGVGTFTRTSTDAINPLPSSLTTYLANQFDPANPIATGTDNPNLRREIAWVDGDIELPQVWRGNLGVERKLPFLDSIVSAEVVYTKIDQALFMRNENLKLSISPSADGRKRFSGNPGTLANAKYSAFTDLWHVSNVGVGESTYFTVAWDRPIKDRWGFNFAYIRGRSTEAQAIGQTTASGQWQRNVIFNQGEVELGTSDFEIKDRVTLSFSRQFQFVRKWYSTASIYYEGRSGNPYSFVYDADLNGDGRADNDIVAVPGSLTDARFDFSAMNATQQAAYMANIEALGLSENAGGIATKNSFREPWVNRLDLHLEQVIPVHNTAVRLKLFFDWVNLGSFISKDFFGYTETSPLILNDVFRRRVLSGARYGADGRIQPGMTAMFRNNATGVTTRAVTYSNTPVVPVGNTLVGVDVQTPGGFNIDNGMSRWRIQLGAKLEF